MISRHIRYILLLAIWTMPIFHQVKCIEVKRFELFTTRHGLSQNSVLSSYCDSKGFMWFGTMNGLNLYDGYSFKIFKTNPGKENALYNNRVTKIWEDSRDLLWIETHDGYYHHLNRETENFYTFPRYLNSDEEKNSAIVSFHQTSRNEIWLSTTNAGVYFLKYDSIEKQYNHKRFISRGLSSITNNSTSFVLEDPRGNIWIGTRNGLNLLSKNEKDKMQPEFQHYFVDLSFTSAIMYSEDIIWFGTKQNGIIIYDIHLKRFLPVKIDFGDLENTEITTLVKTKKKQVAIGTVNKGLHVYDTHTDTRYPYKVNGSKVTSIYEDLHGHLWINTEKFGIQRIDPFNGTTKYFNLTPDDIKPLVDDERQFIYEDSQGHLWIGTHGGGLAFYERENDEFTYYRNNPNDPSSISSDFVHCITEDKSGLIWVGTGQYNGGVNKIITANPSFIHVQPQKKYTKFSENVIRSVFTDSNGFIWLATKAGNIHIYNQNYEEHTSFYSIALKDQNLPGHNIYCITEDNSGHIWLGSKGGGIFISEKPLKSYGSGYSNIRFIRYENDPADSHSLSSNMVYSILQDSHNQIWIGTYGGGLNLVTNRTESKLTCKRITTGNSNISNDEIRQVYEDSKGRTWVATTFGLNKLFNKNYNDSVLFKTFTYDPKNPKSLSYNDIIHIYEDSNNRLWFATFGGGVNILLEHHNRDSIGFKSYNYTHGLANDAVFGILEDAKGNLWFSTEYGISKFDIANEKFENYDESSGLLSGSFSENTCCVTKNGNLLFGTTNGVLIISPDNMVVSNYIPPVVLTNFQLFNKDIDIYDEKSPIKQTITTLSSIQLKYNQSSFSIEYAALDFFDPSKNQYAFMLENFDTDWNYVNNQRKATYTNLKPGNYTFKVMGSGWDGIMNETPTTLEITILPPWWKTQTAYLIYFFVFIILINISRRLFTRFNKMRNDLRVERKLNEMKLQFFTNISHEIRTPLTLILGPLEEIRKSDELPAILHSPVELMYLNGNRMLRLINQLLDFRKIQNNKMTLKIKQVDLVRFTDNICKNFNHLAKKKNINFHFHSSFDRLDVYIDPDKIDMVLFNLLSNAFKFTSSEKSIQVKLKLAKNKEHAKIIIQDEGIGIAEEKQHLLVNRFTSLSGKNSFFGSSGIGLALSKEIMKLHKSDIKVKSQLGTGSKFIVEVPLGKDHFKEELIDIAESPSEQIVPTNIQEPENLEKIIELQSTITSGNSTNLGEFPGILISSPNNKPDNELTKDDRQQSKNKKYQPVVLVAEDNPDVANYISKILDNEFRVLLAVNGSEALSIVKSRSPDLVITDIMMPVMDGIDMTKKIKSDFEISHIPVIMLTAKSNYSDQIEGVESGAEAYLLKPFNPLYLKAVVKNLIKQREVLIKKFTEKQEIEPGEIKITSRDELFLNNIVSLIEKNYSDPAFNVEKLAELSTVGRTLFYNKIKGLTGFSPVELLRQMRLKIAARIINNDVGYSISEIAYMTGFNDEKYFSRCFKSQFGKSPSEFKKNLV